MGHEMLCLLWKWEHVCDVWEPTTLLIHSAYIQVLLLILFVQNNSIPSAYLARRAVFSHYIDASPFIKVLWVSIVHNLDISSVLTTSKLTDACAWWSFLIILIKYESIN